MIIAPSILSADFARLGVEVQAVQHAGADWIHLDAMDNHFVPNLTIGPMVCAAIRPLVEIPIDVHLMVEPVDAIAIAFAKAGANTITFHPEATKHVDRTIALIRDHGCQPGIALNPATSLTWLDHTIHLIDLVLLMSVNPGFGGQTFIPHTLHTIAAAKLRIDAHHHTTGRHIELQVDGGINSHTVQAVQNAGASAVVAGSAIFNNPDAGGGYTQAIQALKYAKP